MTATETRRAVKAHRCTWCWTSIDAGETYRRYRFFDGDETRTAKMHPECFDAMQELEQREGGWIEWIHGDHPRGCNCAHERGCERCAARTELRS